MCASDLTGDCLKVEECACDLAKLSVPVILQHAIDLVELPICEQCTSDLAELSVGGGGCQ